jgi:nickel-type superoxide dismutase maturation protease
VNLVVLRLRVEGLSMAPTYLPGERLTAGRHWRRVRQGDVVVVRDPRDSGRWLLKRCVGRTGSRLDLRGDNPEASTDSRDFGPVPARAVTWIVIGGRPRRPDPGD